MNDDDMIDTPEGAMTWAAWKKRNPVQIPSRRTKGKDLPNKVKRFTVEPPGKKDGPSSVTPALEPGSRYPRALTKKKRDPGSSPG